MNSLRIRKLINKNPHLANLAYSAAKSFWKAKAVLFNYNYPDEEGKTSISIEKVKEYNKTRLLGPKSRICYAPFNNMHFQMNGDVSACSFNYDYLIGNVNQNTIFEIWFGEKANEFRDTLANYNLDKCLSCKNVFNSGNYSSFPPLKYELYAEDNTLYPTQMSFELSNLCNYECIMCNENFSSLIRKRKNLPPLRYAYPDSFTDQLTEFLPHLRIVTFIGGEPLLIKQYFEITEKILEKNKKCVIHFQTNASYLPERFIQLLDLGQFEIGVSLDGIRKETFESIRLNSDFEAVMKNVKILADFHKKGKILMNINYCPLVNNWQELPELLNFATELNISLKIVNVENPKHLSLHQQSSSYLQQILDYYRSYQLKESAHRIALVKNKQALKDFILQLEYLKVQALKREDFILKHSKYSYRAIKDMYRDMYYTNPLFSNITDTDKNIILQEVFNYVDVKDSEDNNRKTILLYSYYSLFNINHAAEGESVKNIEFGIRMLKGFIDDFNQLLVDQNSRCELIV